MSGPPKPPSATPAKPKKKAKEPKHWASEPSIVVESSLLDEDAIPVPIETAVHAVVMPVEAHEDATDIVAPIHAPFAGPRQVQAPPTQLMAVPDLTPRSRPLVIGAVLSVAAIAVALVVVNRGNDKPKQDVAPVATTPEPASSPLPMEVKTPPAEPTTPEPPVETKVAKPVEAKPVQAKPEPPADAKVDAVAKPVAKPKPKSNPAKPTSKPKPKPKFAPD